MTYRDRCGITEIDLASFQNDHVRVVCKGILTSSYAEKMKVGCIAIVEIEVNHRLNPFRKMSKNAMMNTVVEYLV